MVSLICLSLAKALEQIFLLIWEPIEPRLLLIMLTHGLLLFEFAPSHICNASLVRQRYYVMRSMLVIHAQWIWNTTIYVMITHWWWRVSRLIIHQILALVVWTELCVMPSNSILFNWSRHWISLVRLAIVDILAHVGVLVIIVLHSWTILLFMVLSECLVYTGGCSRSTWLWIRRIWCLRF